LTLHDARGGYRDFLQKIWKETSLVLWNNLPNRARFKTLQLLRKKFPYPWRILELSRTPRKLIAFRRDMNDRFFT
jgi:hypothetical protein